MLLHNRPGRAVLGGVLARVTLPGGEASVDFRNGGLELLWTEILQMNPKPASMFAFSRPSCKTDARC
jgi:hypothetical protein